MSDAAMSHTTQARLSRTISALHAIWNEADAIQRAAALIALLVVAGVYLVVDRIMAIRWALANEKINE